MDRPSTPRIEEHVQDELTADSIAARAQELKAAFVGVILSLPVLLDPEMPLLDVLRRYGQTHDSPIAIRRLDGSDHSTMDIRFWLTRCSSLRGEILAEDLLSFAMMLGATRVWDMVEQAGLRDPDQPLLEFARHFRNACAHGDRWHFLGGEPRHRAALRERELQSSLHGTRATYVWVAPGDYLDFLDDISSLMS